MNDTKYKWLLFDADETLFDFHQASKLAFSDALRLHELEETVDHYPTYKQVNNRVWKELEDGHITQVTLRSRRFALFFEKVGIKADPANFNRVYLEQLIGHTDVLPGAMELLGRLKGKFRLAIITNGLKEVQRPRLRHTALLPLFDVVVVSDEIGYAKPHTGFFDHTFQEMAHSDKDSVLVIGDSLNSDIRGGIHYGVDTCWFNPNGLKNATDLKPTFEIDRLESLDALVFNP